MSSEQERPTEEVRKHHAHLMEHIVTFRETLDQLRTGLSDSSKEGLKEADWFLSDVLIPHAEWEEKYLYPEVGELIRKHGNVTGTMELEHRVLMRLIGDFREKYTQVKAGTATPDQLDEIRKLGYRIDSLLTTHFDEEEDVLLEMADEHMSKEDIDRIVASGEGHHH